MRAEGPPPSPSMPAARCSSGGGAHSADEAPHPAACVRAPPGDAANPAANPADVNRAAAAPADAAAAASEAYPGAAWACAASSRRAAAPAHRARSSASAVRYGTPCARTYTCACARTCSSSSPPPPPHTCPDGSGGWPEPRLPTPRPPE
eukprot:279731-Chlamydomonas_euryale.AAC.1